MTSHAGPRRPRFALLTVLSVTTGLALSLAVVGTPSQASPSATPYDFDADGYTDLAFGIPGEDWGDPLLEDAGAVQVIYGARYNLKARRTRSYWTANKPGIKGDAGPRDAAGSSTASGDFDRDGYADLALNSADGISVLYGGPDGLTARDQLLTPSHTGADDGWGSSLVAGDFDGDGRDDLAMGGHGLAQQPEAGSVTVLRGTPRGLTYSGAVRLTKDSPGIEGTATKNDAFGRHLVSGDVTGDGRDDLALVTGSPDDGGWGSYVLLGSPGGLTGEGSSFYDSDTPGLATPGATFGVLGSAVALGDFDADGHADVALGDPRARPAGTTCPQDDCPGGAVLVLPGSATGPTTVGRRLWSQASPGVPEAHGPGLGFGKALATGDLNGDGRSDLAVSVAGPVDSEDLHHGSVNVLYGGPAGLTGVGAQVWSQASPGIHTEQGVDGFGSQLRIGNFDQGPAADLAVQAGGSFVKGQVAAGAVSVLYGSPRGVTNHDQLWTQDTPGIPGRVEIEDFFGETSGLP